MRNLPNIAALLFITLIFACSKSNSERYATGSKPLFHKDIVIREMINGSEQAQNMLLLKAIPEDPEKIVAIASRGIYENEAEGFRFLSLNKNSEVVTSNSFKLSSIYTIQFATCATMDKKGNVWVAGHVFGGANSYGKPFVAKITSSGELVFSKFYQTSVEYDNLRTFRSIGITSLINGDVLLVTHSGYEYQLLRLAEDGTIVWKKLITNSYPTVYFSDPFSVGENLSNVLNVATELSDHSIVLHAFNNNSPVKDYLIKVDAFGKLLFAKSYSNSSQLQSSPAQLLSMPGNRILWASQKGGNLSGLPYAYILSDNGEILKAKGHKVTAGVNNPFEINEVGYFDDKIYLTTTGGYEFSTYLLNNDLTVISGEKVLGSTVVSTNRGGLSLYDEKSKTMVHVLDLAGVSGDGNGFQFISTTASGKSCREYVHSPEPLVFSDIVCTVSDEPLIKIKEGFKIEAKDLYWGSYPFSIVSQDTMCEE